MTSNGDYYHDHLNNGDRHGNGKNSLANGKIYESNWKDNKQIGKG